MAIDKTVHGRSGTDLSFGEINRPLMPSRSLGGDYNAEFDIDVVDHMLRGDGQVTAAWNAIALTIRQAEWDVVAYSESEKDKEIAAFVEEILRPIWSGLLTQILNYLPYGFMLFEPIYGVSKGKVIWERLAPRLPWTVEEWHAKDGRVDKVVQNAWDEKSGGYRDFTIPGRKLLRFTNQQQGESFEGISMLRGAYKHWHFKDLLYNILIMRQERYGVGVPVGTLPESANDEQEEKMREILRNLRSNEVGYVYLPKGADIEECIKILVPEGGEAGASGLLEGISHHDVAIARSMLAQFLSLGETRSGSRAVSQDMSSVFLMSLGAVVRYIGEIMSCGNPGECGGIRELVDINFANVEGYPVWKCERIRKENAAALAAVIAQLVQAGALVHDEGLEKYTRRLLGVPWEDIEIAQEVLPAQPNIVLPVPREEHQTATGGESHKLAEVAGANVFLRDRNEWDKHVRYSGIEIALDRGQASIVSSWREHYGRQLERIGNQFGEFITRDDFGKISTLKMPLVKRLARSFARVLTDAHAAGITTVRNELLRQVDDSFLTEKILEPYERVAATEAAALVMATRLADTSRRNIQSTCLQELSIRDEVPWDDVSARAWAISDTWADEEAAAVVWAFGLGRNAARDVFLPLIADEYYSSVLDVNTCAVCHALHGVTRREQHFITPNPDCLGNVYGSGFNPCRCITVMVLREGVQADGIMALG